MGSRRLDNDRYSDILAFVVGYQDRNGISPTMREILAEIDIISTSTARYNLQAMQNAGLITLKHKTARSIVVTEKGYALVADRLPQHVVSVDIPAQLHRDLLVMTNNNIVSFLEAITRPSLLRNP